MCTPLASPGGENQPQGQALLPRRPSTARPPQAPALHLGSVHSPSRAAPHYVEQVRPMPGGSTWGSYGGSVHRGQGCEPEPRAGRQDPQLAGAQRLRWGVLGARPERTAALRAQTQPLRSGGPAPLRGLPVGAQGVQGQDDPAQHVAGHVGGAQGSAQLPGSLLPSRNLQGQEKHVRGAGRDREWEEARGPAWGPHSLLEAASATTTPTPPEAEGPGHPAVPSSRWARGRRGAAENRRGCPKGSSPSPHNPSGVLLQCPPNPHPCFPSPSRHRLSSFHSWGLIVTQGHFSIDLVLEWKGWEGGGEKHLCERDTPIGYLPNLPNCSWDRTRNPSTCP